MDNLGFILLAVVAAIFAVSVYFLPTIEAVRKGSPDVNSILVINFFLGWLLIPWVIAMAWAYKNGHKEKPAAQLRNCPYCAEPIQPEAIRCKHCLSDLFPAVSPSPRVE